MVEGRAAKVLAPELEELTDARIATRRAPGAGHRAQERAGALPRLVVTERRGRRRAVRFQQVGAQELAPLATEQAGVVEGVETAEGLTHQDHGAQRVRRRRLQTTRAVVETLGHILRLVHARVAAPSHGRKALGVQRAVDLRPHLVLVRLLEQLAPQRGLGHVGLGLELLAAAAPASLLHAVDGDRPRPAQRRQQDVLAQHAVLLAADEDLAGQHEDVCLAAVVHDELRHRRAAVLGDEQLAAGLGLVERDHRDQRSSLTAVEPHQGERGVAAPLGHGIEADPRSP